MSDDEKAVVYRKKLDDLYVLIQRLTPTSPQEDFDAFAQFFSLGRTVYLKSMNMHRMPGISRVEAAEDMGEVLEKVRIQSREVLHFGVSYSPGADTVFCETKQKIDVMGDVLDPFFETEVVTFDKDGLISCFKNYCCWSPIVVIVQ
jgi:hypothetical protein